MDIFNLLNMLGGLSLFLYGMSTMGQGLSKMAGGKLESILEKLTNKKIYAVLLGAGVTAIIQSSSATTVMVVGFVNSGIMKLSQTVGVIMGANIGTTITSWLLSLTGIKGSSLLLKLLKPSSFSPVLSLIGIILLMSNKEESKKKDVGGILLGFAILMFGMETMSSSVSGLSNNVSFTNLMVAFSNPLLGMLAGAILTAIIQSSSASVGILQALCFTGAINYSVALPIIMGQNIGTCVTSIISSIGANKNAKRAAMIHLYFNLVGTIIFMVGFYLLNVVLRFNFLNVAANVSGIALIHSLFNIGATILLYPLSNLLVKLAEITIKEDGVKENEIDTISIDERFIDSPAFAVEICKAKARDMAKLVNDSVTLAFEILKKYDENKFALIKKQEEMGDKYEDILGSYLIKLSSKNISKEDSQSLSLILHSISDLERISDHAMEIGLMANDINFKKYEFSKEAQLELETLMKAVEDICVLTTNSFCLDDINLAKHIEPLEEVIDTLTKMIKENHITRLQKGKCTIELGFILEDILNGLERISDHCSNVAIEMITIYDNDYNTHEYFNSFSIKEKDDFDKEYEKLFKKYSLYLNARGE